MDTRGGVAPEGVFERPFEQREGVYRALSERPHVPLAQQSNFWTLTAALYEPLWRHRSISLLTGGALSTDEELGLLFEWLEPRPGQRVLDAGSSAGLYARTLLKHGSGLEVHALDFSLPFLRQAQRYAERDGVMPVLVHADVRRLPYRNAVFDAIVCGGSLNEFTDLPQTLTEFVRVLKPGGRVFLMALLQAEGRAGRALQSLLGASGLEFSTSEGLEAAFADAGLSCERTRLEPPVVLKLFRRLPPRPSGSHPPERKS